MSLLMDALKKAELAKRQGRGEDTNDAAGNTQETPGATGMALEPLSPSAETPPAAADTAQGTLTLAETLPSLPSHLETLDEEFLAEIEKTSRRLPPGSAGSAATAQEPRVQRTQPAIAQRTSRQEQTAAQNLFAAKQPDDDAHKKNFALALGGLTALAAVAIGTYFWWQLQPRPGLAVNLAAGAGMMPRPGLPPAPAVPSTQAMPAAPAHVAALHAAAANSPAATNASEAAAEDGDDTTVATTGAGRGTMRRTNIRPALSRNGFAPAETDEPIRLTKAPLQVDPSLMRGFDAFNRGDLASAQTEYTRALQSDPRNTDAMHGLAAILLRQGQLDQAAWDYQKILEANPQDSVALAALINIRSQVDPAAAESRLKLLAAAQPELAAPYFSLGNLYARQGRWNEAQQAYFRAYNAEPENPDILYNLAISLEHIRQIRLAAQYYAQAIAAAQTRPAGFDKAQAATRMHALQP